MNETTQRTEAGYLAARAAYYEALASEYEAAAAKYDADPLASPATREDMVAYYRAAAERHRGLAAEDRAAMTCPCGGKLGRICDAPCRCQSEALHPTTGERELLSSLGCEIHAEVTP
jgi:hypothetical protein